MTVSLAGKVAVVTGASSGMGLAVTEAFLDAEAAAVIGVFRTTEVARELADCQARFGEQLGAGAEPRSNRRYLPSRTQLDLVLLHRNCPPHGQTALDPKLNALTEETQPEAAVA